MGLILIGIVLLMASFFLPVHRSTAGAIRVVAVFIAGFGLLPYLLHATPVGARNVIDGVYVVAGFVFLLWYRRRDLVNLKRTEPARYEAERHGDPVTLWLGCLVILASLIGYGLKIMWLQSLWLGGAFLIVAHLYWRLTVRRLDRDQ